MRVWCVRVGDEACGAGPVRPKRLTEPVTAILYITADHEHMNELKHTIHVVEVR